MALSNDSRLRRSLRTSCAEGMIAEVFAACAGGAVLTGWALFLGASPLLIGLLGALPYLAHAVQFPAAWLSSRGGYRRVALGAVTAARQMALPLVFLPFLPLSVEAQRGVLLAVAAASAVLGVVGNNAWSAWMGDLVPTRIRGRYFGRRTALCAVGSTSASMVAGVLLDRAKHSDHTALALAGLSGVAYVAGLVCTALMAAQHDPNRGRPKAALDFRAILLPAMDPRARRLLTYQLAWNAAVGISSTFLTLHMLQNLKMGFARVALYNGTVACMKILTVPLWGRAMDRVGPRTVLGVCSLGISLIPLWWLWPQPDFLWPLLLEPVVSGALWAGQGLATFALPLEVAPRHGRAFYLAAFSTAAGLAFATGTALGGALAQRLPAELTVLSRPMFGLQVLFVVSSLGRIAAACLALRMAERRAQPAIELARMASRGLARLVAPLRVSAGGE